MNAGAEPPRPESRFRNVVHMDLHTRVLSLLATPRADTRFAQAYLVNEIVNLANCRPHEVYDALWGLVGEGLVYLDSAGQGSSADD